MVGHDTKARDWEKQGCSPHGDLEEGKREFACVFQGYTSSDITSFSSNLPVKGSILRDRPLIYESWKEGVLEIQSD